jgi:hypothetical protein
MRPYAWSSVFAASALAAGMFSGSVASAAGGNGNPEWYLPQNHVSAAGDVLAGGAERAVAAAFAGACGDILPG